MFLLTLNLNYRTQEQVDNRSEEENKLKSLQTKHYAKNMFHLNYLLSLMFLCHQNYGEVILAQAGAIVFAASLA